MSTHIKKRVSGFALAALAFVFFLLSRYFAERYSVQSGAAMHRLPVSPGPQHYHDLEHYAYFAILLLAVVCLFLKRWLVAVISIALFVLAFFTDVTY
jgi:hypothetical protein